MLVTFHHKGWFGLCPVFINHIDEDIPVLAARHPIFDLWFDLHEKVFSRLPAAPLLCTGRLKNPVTLQTE